MKILKIVLISCLLLIAAQSVAFAGSGKAIIPHWRAMKNGSSVHQYSHVYITNISKSNLVVKLTFYGKNGGLSNAYLNYMNFQNNNTEIGPGKTAIVGVNAPYTGAEKFYGYGVIEWSNKDNEDDAVGLVAWGSWVIEKPVSAAMAVTINDGKPF